MIRGERIEVIRRKEVGEDGYGEPVFEDMEPETVFCVVAPGSPEEASESNRRQGDVIAYTLHFPKTYTAGLADAHVVVRGKRLRVIGDPDCYTPENTPGLYNRPVSVVSING